MTSLTYCNDFVEICGSFGALNLAVVILESLMHSAQKILRSFQALRDEDEIVHSTSKKIAILAIGELGQVFLNQVTIINIAQRR